MDELSEGTFDYHTLVATFDTMVVIGFVMIAMVLIPAWRSSEIQRLKTWFAFMIAGLVVSVSYFLLVGHQFGEEPAFGLCLFQASLIYGAPVLTGSFSLSFTVELYVILFNAVRGVGRSGPRESSKWFIALPLILYFAVLCEVLVTGLLDHSKIVRNPSHVYCYATVSYPYYITGIVGLLTTMTIFFLEGVMLHMLVVTRKELGLHRSANKMFPASLFFRALLFSFWTAVGIGLSAAVLVSTIEFSAYWVLFFPAFCIATSIIFGSQKDILKFYRDFFVKRTKNRDSLRQIPDALEMPIRRSAQDDYSDV